MKKFLAIAISALLVSALGLLAACNTTPEIKQYVSPYNWANLHNKDSRYYYYKDDTIASRVGIDVSSHQGKIDWNAVAADGVEFAYIRLGNRGATEGLLYLDEQYQANIAGAREAGLLTGIYFFSQSITEEEAREEADFVISNLNGIDQDYPIIYDHEPVSGVNGRANNLSRDQLTKNAQAFCERIQQAGFDVAIYGNKQDIANINLEALPNYDIWFAEYDVSVPSGQFDFNIWQYSNNGSIAGISTQVDMNIHFLEA